MDFSLLLSGTGLSGLSAATLVLASFFTSFVSAAFGLGGGLALLALMAQLMPAAAIIPVHGLVQLASNFGRAGLLLKAVDWHRLWPFFSGAVIGAPLGGLSSISLSTAVLQGLLGGFILLMTWAPTLPSWTSGRFAMALNGAGSTVLTMFVGATGPFIAAALKPLALPPETHVASFSAAMTCQHALKTLVFGTLGFAFGPYLGLVAAMIMTGFAGTWVGTRLLAKRDGQAFHTLLKWILTALAIRLLFVSLVP
ncbi:MAG: TSUP family transporter [Sphingomonadales bacterium]